MGFYAVSFVTAYWLEIKISMFHDGATEHYVLQFCDVKIRPGIYYLSYRCYL